ncbi:hypothetical protein SYNPS1DRAFT_23916, partial [Syncephalis pseudoplumigaleata]
TDVLQELIERYDNWRLSLGDVTPSDYTQTILTESTEDDYMSTWNFSTIKRSLPTSSTVRGTDHARPASFSSESMVLSTSQHDDYQLPSDISDGDTIRSTIRLMDLQATTDENGNTALEATEHPDGTVRRIPLARASMVIPPDEAEDTYLVGKELALSVLLPALAKIKERDDAQVEQAIQKVEQGVLELERTHPELLFTVVAEIVAALQSSHPEIQERVGLPATAVEIHHPVTADAATMMTIIRGKTLKVRGDGTVKVIQKGETGVQTSLIINQKDLEDTIAYEAGIADAATSPEADASTLVDSESAGTTERDGATEADATEADADDATSEASGGFFMFNSPIVAYLYNRWYSKWTFT